MEMKKSLRNLIIAGSLIVPWASLLGHKYFVADKVTKKVEYLDEKPGISREDVVRFRCASFGLYEGWSPREGKVVPLDLRINDLDYCKYPLNNFQFREHLMRSSADIKHMKILSSKLDTIKFN
jgi:hypothetical protein